MIRIRCLECREPFRWNAANGWPSHCPICKAYIGSDDKDEVAAPFISSISRKVPDLIYRDMERTSANRVAKAAEMLGVSPSDVSHLGMTNLNEGQREGDRAFSKNLTAEQTRMSNEASFSNSAAVQASAGTRVGPLPQAGTNYIQNILKPQHARQNNTPVTNHPSIEFWKPR